MFEAYDLLLDPNNHDKSETSKYFDGLKLCTNAKHIHIQSDEELDQVIQSLESRADGVLKRSNALRTNWENRHNG